MVDQQYLKGAFLVVAATLCFAFQPIFGRLAYSDGMDAIGLLWLRFLLAAVLLHLFTRRGDSGSCLKPFLIGVVLSAGAMSYFTALQSLSVGLTTLLFYLFPIYIFLFSVLLRQESVSWLKLKAVILAITGISVSVDTESSLPFGGLVCGLIAGACYGGYIMLSNRYLVKEKPFQSLKWVTTGAVCCISLPFLAGQGELPQSAVGFGAALGLCLICTLLSLMLLLIGTRMMGRSTDVAVITTVEIGSTLFLAWLLLNETIRLQEIIGAGLVFVAAIVVVLARGREQKAVG